MILHFFRFIYRFKNPTHSLSPFYVNILTYYDEHVKLFGILFSCSVNLQKRQFLTGNLFTTSLGSCAQTHFNLYHNGSSIAPITTKGSFFVFLLKVFIIRTPPHMPLLVDRLL